MDPAALSAGNSLSCVISIALTIVLVALIAIPRLVRKRRAGKEPCHKEPWDPKRFEELYNAIAAREGGHPLRKSRDLTEVAPKAYLWGKERTLEEFAQGWFEYDQL